MSTMIAMAIFDTEENGRSKYTAQTLKEIFATVDLVTHRLIIIDNNSCRETKEICNKYAKIFGEHDHFKLITNTDNIGTARAINQAWKLRKPHEHLIKMDNDCVVNSFGWVEEMEEAIERDPSIGIIGLKRNDLFENPWRNDMFKSTLRMLPHQNGQRWIIVEDVAHVMGTCQMYNWRLIDKMGGLVQPSIYGFDDTLASVRSHIAGFKNCFLPHIEIDHIDKDENPYWQEKRQMAEKDMEAFNDMKNKMILGQIPIYHKL